MTKDMVIENIPVVNQLEASDKFWKYRACGVAVIKMILVSQNKDLNLVSLDELIEKGLECGAYVENVGWRHQGLVCLAEKYGVALTFQKEFFKTAEDKIKGLKIINKELLSKRPVAVSVHPGFNGQKDSHLLLAVGMNLKNSSATGYYIQDPYKGIRGHKYFVTKKEFLDGWRGGMIFLA